MQPVSALPCLVALQSGNRKPGAYCRSKEAPERLRQAGTRHHPRLCTPSRSEDLTQSDRVISGTACGDPASLDEVTMKPGGENMAGKGKTAGPLKKKAGLPRRTDQPREPTDGPPLWATVAVFVLGAIGFVFLASFVTSIPCPTKIQIFFFQIVASLSAAGLAWAIPGFLRVVMHIPRAGQIRAGGAIAIFIIVFLITPSQIDGGRTCDPMFNMTVRFLAPTANVASGSVKVFLGSDQRQMEIGPNGEIEVKGIDRSLIGKTLRLRLDSSKFHLRDSPSSIAEYKLTGDNLLEVYVEPTITNEVIPDAGLAPAVVPQRQGEQASRPELISYAPDTPPEFTKLVSAAAKAEQLGQDALPCPVQFRIAWTSSTLTVYGRCICKGILGTEQSVAVASTQRGVIPVNIGSIVLHGVKNFDWKNQGCR